MVVLTPHQQHSSRKQAGFTLVELLVVTTLSVLLMLTISAMFMTFLLSNSRSNIRRTVITEGNFTIRQMEFLLRNATKLVANSSLQTCTNAMNSIAFQSVDGGFTELIARTDSSDGRIKVASMSGFTTPNFLTSSSVTLQNDQVTFNCTDDNFTKTVEIFFTLSKNTADGNVSEDFTSRITLRN